MVVRWGGGSGYGQCLDGGGGGQCLDGGGSGYGQCLDGGGGDGQCLGGGGGGGYSECTGVLVNMWLYQCVYWWCWW